MILRNLTILGVLEKMKNKTLLNSIRGAPYDLKCQEASDNNISSLIFRTNYFQIEDLDIKSIIDLGSQQGQFARLIQSKKNIQDITCLDVSRITVEKGIKRNPDFKWINKNFMDFKPTRTYDLVLCLNWLFYLNLDERAFTFLKINKMLNKGGNFLLSFGDSNFAKKNLTFMDITKEVEKYFKIMNICRVNELAPLFKIDPNKHTYLGRWYTSLLLQKK